MENLHVSAAADYGGIDSMEDHGLAVCGGATIRQSMYATFKQQLDALRDPNRFGKMGLHAPSSTRLSSQFSTSPFIKPQWRTLSEFERSLASPSGEDDHEDHDMDGNRHDVVSRADSVRDDQYFFENNVLKAQKRLFSQSRDGVAYCSSSDNDDADNNGEIDDDEDIFSYNSKRNPYSSGQLLKNSAIQRPSHWNMFNQSSTSKEDVEEEDESPIKSKWATQLLSLQDQKRVSMLKHRHARGDGNVNGLLCRQGGGDADDESDSSSPVSLAHLPDARTLAEASIPLECRGDEHISKAGEKKCGNFDTPPPGWQFPKLTLKEAKKMMKSGRRLDGVDSANMHGDDDNHGAYDCLSGRKDGERSFRLASKLSSMPSPKVFSNEKLSSLTMKMKSGDVDAPNTVGGIVNIGGKGDVDSRSGEKGNTYTRTDTTSKSQLSRKTKNQHFQTDVVHQAPHPRFGVLGSASGGVGLGGVSGVSAADIGVGSHLYEARPQHLMTSNHSTTSSNSSSPAKLSSNYDKWTFGMRSIQNAWKEPTRMTEECDNDDVHGERNFSSSSLHSATIWEAPPELLDASSSSKVYNGAGPNDLDTINYDGKNKLYLQRLSGEYVSSSVSSPRFGSGDDDRISASDAMEWKEDTDVTRKVRGRSGMIVMNQCVGDDYAGENLTALTTAPSSSHSFASLSNRSFVDDEVESVSSVATALSNSSSKRMSFLSPRQNKGERSCSITQSSLSSLVSRHSRPEDLVGDDTVGIGGTGTASRDGTLSFIDYDIHDKINALNGEDDDNSGNEWQKKTFSLAMKIHEAEGSSGVRSAAASTQSAHSLLSSSESASEDKQYSAFPSLAPSEFDESGYDFTAKENDTDDIEKVAGGDSDLEDLVTSSEADVVGESFGKIQEKSHFVGGDGVLWVTDTMDGEPYLEKDEELNDGEEDGEDDDMTLVADDGTSGETTGEDSSVAESSHPLSGTCDSTAIDAEEWEDAEGQELEEEGDDAAEEGEGQDATEEEEEDALEEDNADEDLTVDDEEWEGHVEITGKGETSSADGSQYSDCEDLKRVGDFSGRSVISNHVNDKRERSVLSGTSLASSLSSSDSISSRSKRISGKVAAKNVSLAVFAEGPVVTKVRENGAVVKKHVSSKVDSSTSTVSKKSSSAISSTVTSPGTLSSATSSPRKSSKTELSGTESSKRASRQKTPQQTLSQQTTSQQTTSQQTTSRQTTSRQTTSGQMTSRQTTSSQRMSSTVSSASSRTSTAFSINKKTTGSSHSRVENGNKEKKYHSVESISVHTHQKTKKKSIKVDEASDNVIFAACMDVRETEELKGRETKINGAINGVKVRGVKLTVSTDEMAKTSSNDGDPHNVTTLSAEYSNELNFGDGCECSDEGSRTMNSSDGCDIDNEERLSIESIPEEDIGGHRRHLKAKQKRKKAAHHVDRNAEQHVVTNESTLHSVDTTKSDSSKGANLVAVNTDEEEEDDLDDEEEETEDEEQTDDEGEDGESEVVGEEREDDDEVDDGVEVDAEEYLEDGEEDVDEETEDYVEEVTEDDDDCEILSDRGSDEVEDDTLSSGHEILSESGGNGDVDGRGIESEGTTNDDYSEGYIAHRASHAKIKKKGTKKSAGASVDTSSDRVGVPSAFKWWGGGDTTVEVTESVEEDCATVDGAYEEAAGKGKSKEAKKKRPGGRVVSSISSNGTAAPSTFKWWGKGDTTTSEVAVVTHEIQTSKVSSKKSEKNEKQINKRLEGEGEDSKAKRQSADKIVDRRLVKSSSASSTSRGREGGRSNARCTPNPVKLPPTDKKSQAIHNKHGRQKTHDRSQYVSKVNCDYGNDDEDYFRLLHKNSAFPLDPAFFTRKKNGMCESDNMKKMLNGREAIANAGCSRENHESRTVDFTQESMKTTHEQDQVADDLQGQRLQHHEQAQLGAQSSNVSCNSSATSIDNVVISNLLQFLLSQNTMNMNSVKWGKSEYSTPPKVLAPTSEEDTRVLPVVSPVALSSETKTEPFFRAAKDIPPDRGAQINGDQKLMSTESRVGLTQCCAVISSANDPLFSLAPTQDGAVVRTLHEEMALTENSVTLLMENDGVPLADNGESIASDSSREAFVENGAWDSVDSGERTSMDASIEDGGSARQTTTDANSATHTGAPPLLQANGQDASLDTVVQAAPEIVHVAVACDLLDPVQIEQDLKEMSSEMEMLKDKVEKTSHSNQSQQELLEATEKHISELHEQIDLLTDERSHLNKSRDKAVWEVEVMKDEMKELKKDMVRKDLIVLSLKAQIPSSQASSLSSSSSSPSSNSPKDTDEMKKRLEFRLQNEKLKKMEKKMAELWSSVQNSANAQEKIVQMEKKIQEELLPQIERDKNLRAEYCHLQESFQSSQLQLSTSATEIEKLKEELLSSVNLLEEAKISLKLMQKQMDERGQENDDFRRALHVPRQDISIQTDDLRLAETPKLFHYHVPDVHASYGVNQKGSPMEGEKLPDQHPDEKKGEMLLKEDRSVQAGPPGGIELQTDQMIEHRNVEKNLFVELSKQRQENSRMKTEIREKERLWECEKSRLKHVCLSLQSRLQQLERIFMLKQQDPSLKFLEPQYRHYFGPHPQRQVDHPSYKVSQSRHAVEMGQKRGCNGVADTSSTSQLTGSADEESSNSPQSLETEEASSINFEHIDRVLKGLTLSTPLSSPSESAEPIGKFNSAEGLQNDGYNRAESDVKNDNDDDIPILSSQWRRELEGASTRTSLDDFFMRETKTILSKALQTHQIDDGSNVHSNGNFMEDNYTCDANSTGDVDNFKVPDKRRTGAEKRKGLHSFASRNPEKRNASGRCGPYSNDVCCDGDAAGLGRNSLSGSVKGVRVERDVGDSVSLRKPWSRQNPRQRSSSPSSTSGYQFTSTPKLSTADTEISSTVCSEMVKRGYSPSISLASRSTSLGEMSSGSISSDSTDSDSNNPSNTLSSIIGNIGSNSLVSSNGIGISAAQEEIRNFRQQLQQKGILSVS